MCNAYNHPPGCTCGWGGEGHAGQSSWGGSGLQPHSYWAGVSRWEDREFTRPTVCPECGADVFFIRHNGGSVWVDELGWPWPKHACFDKANEPAQVFSAWTEKSLRFRDPKLGIITEIRSITASQEPLIEIRLTDGSYVSLVLRWTPRERSMAGSLVFLSEEDGILVHGTYAEIPFHSFRRVVATKNRGYACPRCGAWVQENTGHEEHCRKHYRPKSTTAPEKARPEPFPRQQHEELKVVYSTGPGRRKDTDGLRPSSRERSIKSRIEERIQQAIETVSAGAWEAVANIKPHEKQFHQAKKAALELIAKLSPSIKGKVTHLFTSDKWSLLLRLRP